MYTELIRDGQHVAYFGREDTFDYNSPIDHR